MVEAKQQYRVANLDINDINIALGLIADRFDYIEGVRGGVTITNLTVVNDFSTENILPSIDDTYDIGSVSQSWRSLYLDGTLYIDGTNSLTHDGTDFVFNDSLKVTGGLTVTGSLTAAGQSIAGDLTPDADDTYDLGSVTYGWQDLYLTGLLYFDDTNSLTHDGTDFVFNDSLKVTGSLIPNADASYDIGTTTLGWKDLFLTGLLYFDDTNSLTHDGTDFVFNDSLKVTGSLVPNADASYDIGTTALGWKDLFLTGLLYFDDTNSLTHDGTDFVFNDSLKITGAFVPNADASYDIGTTTLGWKDLYLTGSLYFDDTNSLTHDGTDFTFNDSLKITGLLIPNADATNDIGTTTLGWKDLFLTGSLYFDDTNSLTHNGTYFVLNDGLEVNDTSGNLIHGFR